MTTINVRTESYDEIKAKTIQWCQKLLDNKIYDQEKYNKCVGSFIDLGVGQLPSEMKLPENGNEFEYSLYGRVSGAPSKAVISSDINNKIMLATTNNLYLMADQSGFVSVTSTDTITDQEVFQWSLVKRTDTQYSLMSKFGKFLGCDDNGRIDANRNEISNTSIWSVSAINNYITVESIQYKGQYLTADTDVHLAANSGESQKWLITVVPKADEGYIVPLDIVPINAKKEVKLNTIVTLYKQKYQLLAEFKLLDSLEVETASTYKTVMKQVNNNITDINESYNKFIKNIKEKYNRPNDTIASLTTFERAELANYTDINILANLEPDIIKRPTSCPITKSNANNNICDYLQVNEIEKAGIDRITELNRVRNGLTIEINKITNQINQLDRELSEMIKDIELKTNENKRIITGNNIELTRQAGLIDQIQRDNISLDANKAMLEKSAEQASLNQEISDSYQSSKIYSSYVLYGVTILVVLLVFAMVMQFMKKIV
jgi:hypothetical protein